MKTQTLLLSLLALSAWTASAQVDIPILNPKFDLDQLPCTPGGGCYAYSVSGWICGPSTVLKKASTTQFKNAPPGGLYNAAIGNTSASGSILQMLGDALQANTTYVLTLTVGAQADYPFTGYEAELLAGNVIVAAGNKATPVGGAFVIEDIIYNSGAAPAQLGRPLQIFVKSLGTGAVSVASVKLTATAN